MKCPACGSEQIIEFHGHEACVCGRMLDVDCCQGAPIRCETSETKPEAPTYSENQLNQSMV